MNYVCSCIYCKKEFSAKGIFTHVDRTHLKLNKYSSGNNGKYTEISKNALEKRRIEELTYSKNPNFCSECDAELSYTKKFNKFCSKSCATTFNNRRKIESGWTMPLSQKIKISESLTGRKYVNAFNPIDIISNCENCGNSFTFILTTNNQKHKRFCTRNCASSFGNKLRYKNSRINRPALINYRADCAFKFSLKDYPDEFDFTLVETHGWYKAKNRGDNLGGISRDHMVSVRWGFDNNIPAEHISHPANCQLIQHGKNVSKGTSNSISYQELLERIKHWDEKYKR